MSFLIPTDRFMTAAEFSNAITPFYKTYLGRTPAASELVPWYNGYLTGSAPNVAWNNTVTQFYQAVRGNAADAWAGNPSEGYIIIKWFYNVILDRDPDMSATGFDNWTGWVNHLIEYGYDNTRQGFYDSDEYKKKHPAVTTGQATGLIAAAGLLYFMSQ